MRKLLTLTFVLISATGSSYASNWVEVDGNANVTVHVDKQSLRRTGAKVKVWSRWEFAAQRELKGTFPKQTYQVTKDLSIYHCEDRTSATIQSTRYADLEMSSVVDNQSMAEIPASYSEVVPDTIGESILEFVCRETSQVKKK